MGALSGLKVVDFSRVLAGPYATMMLADMGADVVKVERPEHGDDTRSWGPPYNSDGVSTYFAGVNRNKKSIQLDLRSPEGSKAAFEMAREADIIFENFRPGTMQRLGLDYESIAQVNPQVIYASLSGFGTGAGANIGGYDLMVQAVGGLMSITGTDPKHPTKVGVAVIDVLTGLHLGMGVLAALNHRHNTGKGQKIEINLLSAALSSLTNQASNFVGAGVVGKPMGNRHPSIAPYEVFATANGDLAIAAGNDSLFAKLSRILGIPQILTDSRFTTNSDRVAHRQELATIIEQALASKTASEWFALLSEAGVPAGPVNNIREAFEFATDLGLTPVTQIDNPDGSTTPTVTNPITFSETPVEYRTSPPRLK